jgi:hypothetical protein
VQLFSQANKQSSAHISASGHSLKLWCSLLWCPAVQVIDTDAFEVGRMQSVVLVLRNFCLSSCRAALICFCDQVSCSARAQVVPEPCPRCLLQVVVVSPRNHFVFTPMLPSTAVGTVEFRSAATGLQSATDGMAVLAYWCSSDAMLVTTSRCTGPAMLSCSFMSSSCHGLLALCLCQRGVVSAHSLHTAAKCCHIQASMAVVGPYWLAGC